ncbi:hypothetical protein CXF68_18530 [Tenacibaculum sp. Bg11-29]|uniref:hypothetical protein n=1 Tax=Tenacibaculum sp. Bg11-29 TaxID=2058306 RepID=UPI000C33C686|nr:hypothetical protein [Tenacibaculum sp. Bg11-29]PKH52574.1 hypothetical protein CXF68_18530 [Tenacibaculum sp. Bg11-29]
MLPKKELNIYPKTPENIDALICFYFDDYELDKQGSNEMLMKKTSLSLNQIEFIARKLSEAWNPMFNNFFYGKTTISNLMRYGIDGLTKYEKDWSFGPNSKGRPKIKEFLAFVKNTEIDISFL